MSSTYSRLFVRKHGIGPFVVASDEPGEAPFEDRDLADVSKEFGEVIYLAEQENVGFFHYEHWCGGKLVRRLKYNDDYHWLSVEGETEPWEEDGFFSDAALNLLLSAWDPDQHDEIRAIWARKRIRAENLFPLLDSAVAIRAMRDFWNLTDAR